MIFPSSRLGHILLAIFLLDMVLALTALFHRREGRFSPYRLCISGYLLLAALWALFTGAEAAAETPAARLLYANLSLLPFGFLPLIWLFLAAVPEKAARRLPPPRLLLLLLEPALLNALAWMESSRSLIWRPALLRSPGALSALACCPAPLIGVHTAAACLLVLAGALHRLLRGRKSGLRAGPVSGSLLIAAGLLPWLTDAAFRLNLISAGFYATPLVGGAAALLLAARLVPPPRSGLTPFAFETIVNSMRDPVIVLDLKNRIIRHNTAAERIIARAGGAAPGTAPASPLDLLNARMTDGGELIVGRGGMERSFDMGFSPLLDEQNRRRGNIMVLRDISDRREMERELLSLNMRIKRDLERAVSLQSSLLPRAFRQVPGVRFDWIFEPCDELAGDLFNTFRLDEQHVGFYLLDVSGHGLVAALLSFALGRLLSPLPDQSSLLKRYSSSDRGNTLTRPVEVAEILNRQFPFNTESQQYFSLFYGIYNFKIRLLRYVSAGHGGFAYLPRAGRAAIRVMPSFPIGFVKEPGYVEQRLQLGAGDRVYLFSDGVVEALDSREKQYGNQRLLDVLMRSSGLPLKGSLDALLNSVRRWEGDTQRCDDISVLALEAGAAGAYG